MKICVHQPNFIPWFPFFYKMAMVDIFVIQMHTQFVQEYYQHRFNIGDKWVTKPVPKGKELIVDKKYSDGTPLARHNMKWIEAIKETLGIKTKIVFDYETDLKGTERLIDLIDYYKGDVYVTNPEAKEKYLDENRMWTAGIDIEYCTPPKHLQISIFEAFEKFGIEGCIKQLPTRELCKV